MISIWLRTVGSLLILGGGLALLHSTDSPQPIFTDVTRAAGIQFRHENAASPEKYLIETMGSGAAWLDYDNDGYYDLYLANGTATRAHPISPTPMAALYHSNGDGTFTDVTAKAGVGAEGLFGMGVAAADFDNDGFTDLYVVGYGRSILFRNNGDGTFRDVTTRAGVANAGNWGSSAAWFDYDRDGWLDLVVANYVDWSEANNPACLDQGIRAYCHPNKFHPQRPSLFHNNHDGTFTDVSERSHLATSPGNGLGVVCFDYDGDGLMDIFIANDSMANHLFRNLGNGAFEEAGLEQGVAFGEDGKAEAGMGVDAADYDNDGRLDLFVTHLDLEFNRLYRNLAAGFEDVTSRAKLGLHTYHMSGFGTRFMDYDNDGWRDIFIANGHVLDNVERLHAVTSYAEKKVMFHNNHGLFDPAGDRLGPDFNAPRVGRAAATGDFDNDGDLDILVTNNGQEPQLLRNDGGNRNHWLEIFLVGTRSNRDGIGARVKVVSGKSVQVDQAKGGMSYQAAQDPRLHFGLGEATRIDQVEVRWPSGLQDRITNPAVDRVLTVKEGAGEVPSRFRRLSARH